MPAFFFEKKLQFFFKSTPLKYIYFANILMKENIEKVIMINSTADYEELICIYANQKGLHHKV